MKRKLKLIDDIMNNDIGEKAIYAVVFANSNINECFVLQYNAESREYRYINTDTAELLTVDQMVSKIKAFGTPSENGHIRTILMKKEIIY